MNHLEFNALGHGWGILLRFPVLESSQPGTVSGSHPRTVGRSGCTPAEPYPPNRGSNPARNQKKQTRPLALKCFEDLNLTKPIPVYVAQDGSTDELGGKGGI